MRPVRARLSHLVALFGIFTVVGCGGGGATVGGNSGNTGTGTGPGVGAPGGGTGTGTGAGPGGAPTPTATPTGAAPATGATQIQFAITFPARAASAGVARHPAYVSPSIASLTFTVDSNAPFVVNAPAPNGTQQTVITTEPATPGTHAIAVAEYDQPGGAGKLLGRVAQTNTLAAGRTNVVAFVLNGQLAKIAVQAPTTPFLEGTLMAGYTIVGSASIPFTAVPEDADGNTIVAPGLVPQLTPISASNTAVIATAGADNTFTLRAPVPSADAAYIAIAVAGKDLDGNTVTSAPIEVRGVGAFYVADFTVQKIRVFDDSGTPLALPPNAFANIGNPEGLTYVPGSPGSILVTQTANASSPYVLSFDPLGNPQTLPSQAFSGMSRPLFLAYGLVGSTGELFVPDYFKNSLFVFDTSGNPLPAPGGNFGTGLNPVSAAYDANDRQVYVTNDGSDTLTKYGADGTSLGSASVGSHPMGVAYDPNNKSLYVAYGGTEGAATDGGMAQLPGVTQFSETPAAVSNAAGFTNAKTTAYFTGIAVDPFNKQIYVADAGDATILAFSEAGAAVTLPAGAFGTISATTTPSSDPMAILFVP